MDIAHIMKVLIDIRLLGRGAHSGIPIFTKEVVGRLIGSSSKDSYELFYPGWSKAKLPPDWLSRPNVSVLDWSVPNKILDISNRWLGKPDIGTHSKADIIFSPHFNGLTKGSLPRVLVIHDLSFAHHPTFFSRKQRFWHWLQDWRKQIKSADHLIAVSHSTKEDIIATLGIRPESISVVHPGISQEFKPVDPHNDALLHFQKRYQIKSPYFLYFGALEARKNITQLIAAFDALRTNPHFKGYQLVLAGAPGFGAGEIVKAVRKSKSRNAILILSRVADGDRIFLYNGAIAFVCTSFFEGFGFPPLEAQACGVPVVASNRTSFVETLGDSAVLINPWKTTELADALKSLASDEAIRLRLIAAGLLNAKRFNWDETTRSIVSILKKTHE